ncbi:Serine/threonine-protein kinase PknL [Burkholderiales bacterium]|nr:Serine/threonine-protein kinase PknL [Burkholderiales bacterium]
MSDFFRPCPSCGAENTPITLRCACGALLAGVDLVRREAAPAAAPAQPEASAAASVPTTAPEAASAGVPRRCPHEDCAQLNLPEAESCVYCGRSLTDEPKTSAGLLRLPEALAARFAVQRALPAQGAEAELLLVTEMTSGELRVAKIYRHGIVPKREVQERIARVDPAHRVTVIERGLSQGHAWELMEYCAEGSLRELLQAGPLDAPMASAIVIELAQALAAVHAAGIVHRDLKPENILVRCRQPLDLVLTDFGTSSILDATQRFTGVARTLPYAAPETLSGVIDAKADYWALGVIVLEGALGRHPFAGLSEAVILHALATRGLDAAGIADPALRQLARGLLLRDPGQRWGAEELVRWQRGDASLPEPREAAASGFKEAYRLAGESCTSREQLAAALAKHWREACSDLANGNLMRWFRETESDQDAVRLLIDIRFEKKLHIDLQLLELILHLAPGIPPVWRGEPLDLAVLARQANQALGGDAAARKALSELHERRVLEAYATRGNRFANEALERWTLAADQFPAVWRKWQEFIHTRQIRPAPGEVVKFDDLVYGPAGPICPLLADIHPRLLAASFDPRWATRWKERIVADFAALQASLPWLAELGDLAERGRVDLLALEALLPELRQAAGAFEKTRASRDKRLQEELETAKRSTQAVLSALRQAGKKIANDREAVTTLEMAIAEYYALLLNLRARSTAGPQWQELAQSFGKPETLVARLREATHRLAQHQAISGGWLSLPMLGLAVLFTVVLARFLRHWGLLLGLVVIGGVAAWRLLPGLTLVHQIRGLALRI